jgi:hypothetical protein
MNFVIGLTGGAGKTEVPSGIKKSRYKLGVKRVPQVGIYQVPIFTNGKFGTIRDIEDARYEGLLSEFEVPVYFEVDADGSEVMKDPDSKKNIIPQFEIFNKMATEFIDSKLDEILNAKLYTSKEFGLDNFHPTLETIVNKVFPKAKDDNLVVYDMQTSLHVLWTSWSFTHALNLIQLYISRYLVQPFRFRVSAVHYGGAVYKVSKDTASNPVILTLDRRPTSMFKFYEHEAYIEDVKIRNNTEREDRYTYIYTVLLALQLGRMLGDAIKDVDIYALTSDLIASFTGYGTTAWPDQLPATADDVIPLVRSLIGTNLNVAYPFIDFSGQDIFELLKFWILLSFCINRIKIATTNVVFKMKTRHWERVDVDLAEVIAPQLPSIGSDSTPYLVLADNMALTNGGKQGIILPCAIDFNPFPLSPTSEFNRYHAMKKLTEIPSFGTTVNISHGEIEGTPFEPLDKTIGHFTYKFSQDTRFTEIKYEQDILFDIVFPRHAWETELFTTQHRNLLYLFSLMTNGDVQYSDGLIINPFPRLVGDIPYVNRSVNTHSYSGQAVEKVDTKTGNVVAINEAVTTSPAEQGTPSMVDQTAEPVKQDTKVILGKSENDTQITVDAGIPVKPDVVTSAGSPTQEKAQGNTKEGNGENK